MPRARTRRRVRDETPRYAGVSPSSYLLDTHAWIWWQANDPRLGRMARAAIASARTLYFSAASAWEIGIKLTVGKLKLARDPDIAAELAADGVIPLAISVQHAVAAGRLPPPHRDPFDRLLVAQALEEGLVLVSADTPLSRYGVPVLDART